MSLYLIPKWDLSQFSYVPDFGSFASTLWITIPVLVFAFNHSPAISTFAVSQKERYGEKAEKYASRTLKYTSGILVLFVMLFVFSCVLSLSPQDLSMARAQNISILSYLANKFDAPVIAYFGPFVAFLAISTSFFGHYMGAREGLNGIIVKLTPGAKMVSKRRNRAITIFFLVTLWFVATVNPSILSLIESLGGPIIAIILFLMPMYAIAKVPAMKKYQGKFSNVFITVMGIVTIASLLLSFI
jgi:serine transporter